MKVLTLVAILLFQIPLFAQSSYTGKTTTHFTQQTSRLVPPRPKEQIAQKEAKLYNLAEKYHQATNEQKVTLKKQIEDLLYEALELKILQKEQDIELMNRELKSLSAQKAEEDVNRIKQSLKEIKADLSNRKTNRDKIVARKMKVLLKL